MIGTLAGIAILTAAWTPFALPGGVDQGKDAGVGNDPGGPFTVLGRTQCIHTRKQIIAPTVLHPVEKVLVAPGDRVKEKQPLVEIDADEPKEDLKNKKAILDGAIVALKEAKRLLASVESIQSRGVLPEQRIHEVRTAALKAEADKNAAQAAYEAAKFELEHYTVEAMIEGVVNRIECYPGMVSRPGTTVWGEILDLRELDVVCQLTLNQCERIKVGDEAEVLTVDAKRKIGAGKIVFIGVQVDPKTETVPAHVRLANENLALRCEAALSVRFGAGGKGKDAK
jgi:RND family efflux transporter MFP subunit